MTAKDPLRLLFEKNEERMDLITEILTGVTDALVQIGKRLKKLEATK